MKFILDNGEYSEGLEARGQVQDEQIVVIHQLGARVLLLVGQQGQLLLGEVEGRAIVWAGAPKQEYLLSHPD